MSKRNSVLFLLSFLMFTAFSENNSSSQLKRTCLIEKCDTSKYITSTLTKFKYKKYINKPVQALLNDIGIKYEAIHFVQMKPNFLTFVSVRYSSYVSLDIYISEFMVLKQNLGINETSDVWKIEDFLNEKVSKIRVRTRYGKSLKEFPILPVLPTI